MFSALHAAAQRARWSGDVALDVDGLPQVSISAAELQRFIATDEGKWASDDVLERHFALTNTYNIRVTLPNKEVLELRNIPRNCPDRAEYATRIPIEFPAMRGTTIVEAWPTGSAEVAGYVKDRRYHVHIGEKNLYNEKKGIEAAEKYMDDHPQIRWADRAEDPNSERALQDEKADLARTGVRPPPPPYADSP